MSFQLKFNKKKGKKAKSKSYRKPVANVFGDDNDDNDDKDSGDTNTDNPEQESSSNNQPQDRRSAVNRAIQQEQDAMRKRAEQSLKQAESEAVAAGSIYDYDGHYDSFQKPKDADNNKSSDAKDPKSSRYMTDLLQAAQERNYSRDVAYERKLKRDLEREEAADPTLGTQERFVTSAYQKQLQERKLWQDRQEEHDKRVGTVESGANGMAGFYGNLQRNVAMGGGGGSSKKDDNGDDSKKDSAKPSFLDGFEAAASAPASSPHDPSGAQGTTAAAEDASAKSNKEDGNDKTQQQQQQPPPLTREEKLALREEKLAKARERYFERHPEQRPKE